MMISEHKTFYEIHSFYLKSPVIMFHSWLEIRSIIR